MRLAPKAAACPCSRILVVDDDRDTADTTADLLRLEAHIVLVVYSGLEAIRLADEFLPQLVILDIGMPSMDGYQTSTALRQQCGTRYVVLVAHTGDHHAHTAARARDAGFDYHVVKPATPERLFALAHASVSQQVLPGHLSHV